MWFKVDDNFAFNAKVVEAGNEAIGLWVRAGAWSSAQLTDGFVPSAMALAMAAAMAPAMGGAMADPMAPIERLLHVRLWHEVTGGYQFHDWAEYQPSAEDEKKRRKAKSDAGKRGAAARWNGTSHGTTHGTSHSSSHGASHGTTMPRPVPSFKKNSSTDMDGEFDGWWELYPRKVGRGQALRAFKAARKKVDLPTLTATVQAFAASVVGADPKFVPHASTWLNGERWADTDSPPPPVDVDLPDDIRQGMADLQARHR